MIDRCPVRFGISIAASVVAALVFGRVASASPTDPPPATAARIQAGPAGDTRPGFVDLTGDLPRIWRESAGELTGRVVRPDGLPAPEVPVELFRVFAPVDQTFDRLMNGLDAAGLLGGTRTDPAGRFMIRADFTDASFFLIVDRGSARTELRWVGAPPSADQRSDLGDVALRPTRTWSGAVLDVDGRPIAGAEVVAMDVPSEVIAGVAWIDGAEQMASPAGGLGDVSGRWTVDVAPSLQTVAGAVCRDAATTDADGRFAVRLAGEHVSFLVRDGAHVPVVVSPPKAVGLVGDPATDLIVTLRPGGEIVGHVVDEAGAPVVGARMFGGSAVPGVLDEGARTDAAGRFRFQPEGPPPWLVYIDAADAQHDGSGCAEVEVGAELRDVKVVIEPRRRVSVRVTDRDGTPVDGVQVVAAAAPSRFSGSMISTLLGASPGVPLVESEGLHETSLGAGAWRFIGRGADGSFGWTDVLLRNGREEVELRLARPKPASVRVVGEDGAIAAHARVFAVPATQNLRDTPWRATRDLIVSDETGFAILPRPGVLLADGVADGDMEGDTEGVAWQLAVRHPRFAAAVVTVAPDQEDLTVQLQRPAALEGRVTRGGESPASPRVVLVSSVDTRRTRTTITDAEGRYRIDGLDPGEARVGVGPHAAGASVGEQIDWLFDDRETFTEGRVWLVSGESKAVNLDVWELPVPHGVLTGTLRIDGVPVEGVRVEASCFYFASRGGTVDALTDAEGRFVLRPVPAGSVSVQVHESGGANELGPENTLAAQQVDVLPDAEIEVDLDVRTGGIAGRLVEAGTGRPVVGASLSLLRDGGGVGLYRSTDEDGSIEFPRVATGRYELSIYPRDHRRTSIRGLTVVAGERKDAGTIEVAAKIEVSGVVFPPDGVIVETLWFAQEGPEGVGVGPREGAEVDPVTQRFRCRELGTGRYVVSFRADQGVRNLTIDVPPGGVRDLVLEPVRDP